MSAFVTEEIMRLGLRFCSRRFLLKQPSFRVTSSIKVTCFPSQQFSHVWSQRQSNTWLFRSPVRFYSQGTNHSDEEMDLHLPSLLSAETERGLKDSSYQERLQRCSSPSDVLHLISQYPPTVRQVSGCLTVLWSVTKKLSEEQRRCELQLMFEDPAFKGLLENVLQNVGYMRNKDLAYALLSLVNLGVPQHSLVVQTFLRTCQEKLNDFDEQCLSILASSLKEMVCSPNVQALMEALRLLVEARLPEIKNLMALQTMMRVLGKDTPKELKWKLEKKALSMTDQFSLPNAQYMFSIMASMGFYSKPLLDVCSKRITEDIYGIPFNRLLKLLQSCRELLYRDLHLFTAISDYIASTMDTWTDKQLILFLSIFEDLVFCPDSLMEAYAKKVIANPDILTLKGLLCVLKVYSSLNYDLQHQRQPFLDSLSQAVDSYLPKLSGFQCLKVVYHLCVLGHFPSAPLEQLLQSSTLEQLSRLKFPKSQEKMFQTVDLCLRLDRPSLPRPLTVPASVLGDPTPSSPPDNVSFSQCLHSALGDQARRMLQETVVVENFYLIDGVITKPLPNPTSVTEASSCAVAERSPAESSQRIAVNYAPQSSFCFGMTKPRGILAVKIRHLKILGYDPVLIPEHLLHNISEERRTEILRRLIFPEHHRSQKQPESTENLGS